MTSDILECGRDPSPIWDAAHDGRLDDHVERCPHCQAVVAAHDALSDASGAYVRSVLPPPPALAATVMTTVYAQARSGRLLDLPGHGTRVRVAEAAISNALRAVLDDDPSVVARRCRVEDYDPSGTTRIWLSRDLVRALQPTRGRPRPGTGDPRGSGALRAACDSCRSGCGRRLQRTTDSRQRRPIERNTGMSIEVAWSPRPLARIVARSACAVTGVHGLDQRQPPRAAKTPSSAVGQATSSGGAVSVARGADGGTEVNVRIVAQLQPTPVDTARRVGLAITEELLRVACVHATVNVVITDVVAGVTVRDAGPRTLPARWDCS